jgi:hypothetical protein
VDQATRLVVYNGDVLVVLMSKKKEDLMEASRIDHQIRVKLFEVFIG